MKILSTFLLIFASVLVLAQDNNTLRNGTGYNLTSVSALLDSLQNSNDYVISFRLRLTDKSDETSDYFILTKDGGEFAAYNYLEASNRLETQNLSNESLDLVWKTFIQNDLFTMRDEKDIPNFCLGKYQIYNSYTYEFVILTEGSMKSLSYYNPEYYDNMCYGMAERQKIINSVSAVSYILGR